MKVYETVCVIGRLKQNIACQTNPHSMGRVLASHQEPLTTEQG